MIDTAALQGAIIAQLGAQITDIPVFDYVPPQPDYPYIRIESLIATNTGSKDIAFYTYDVTISVYYGPPAEGGQIGKAPVYAIMTRIAAALDNQQAALAMTGSAAITFNLAYETCLQEDNSTGDGTIFHVVQKYQTFVQTS